MIVRDPGGERERRRTTYAWDVREPSVVTRGTCFAASGVVQDVRVQLELYMSFKDGVAGFRVVRNATKGGTP